MPIAISGMTRKTIQRLLICERRKIHGTVEPESIAKMGRKK
jgi:signal-transduction protein with cAMP-binding, CBS, and nucleotidyltransferase domain